MKTWKKWGFYFVAFYLVLVTILHFVGRRWFYEETIWYKALVFADYPAYLLYRTLLHRLGIPRIYDVPLSMRESIVMNVIGATVGIAWWFILGVALSTVYQLVDVKLIRSRFQKRKRVNP
jgi:hypothetical protein